MNLPLVSLNECTKITTLSRSQLNVLRARGDFPASVSIGERRFAFVRAEVEKWVDDRIAARDKKVAA